MAHIREFKYGMTLALLMAWISTQILGERLKSGRVWRGYLDGKSNYTPLQSRYIRRFVVMERSSLLIVRLELVIRYRRIGIWI